MSNFDNLSDYKKAEAVQLLNSWFWIKRAVIAVTMFIVLLVAGCPSYSVYQQGMSGKAELERAKQNRQIAIQEAEALKESAQLKADAEVIRAKGVKEANDVIAQGLGGAEGYLRYLYIDALNSTNCEIIYVPTEAGLPILEASRKTNKDN